MQIALWRDFCWSTCCWKINFANKPEKLSQGLEGIFLIKDDRGSVTCIIIVVTTILLSLCLLLLLLLCSLCYHVLLPLV